MQDVFAIADVLARVIGSAVLQLPSGYDFRMFFPQSEHLEAR